MKTLQLLGGIQRILKVSSFPIRIFQQSMKIIHIQTPYLRTHYDTRANKRYEGPCGCSEEVSLTSITALTR